MRVSMNFPSKLSLIERKNSINDLCIYQQQIFSVYRKTTCSNFVVSFDSILNIPMAAVNMNIPAEYSNGCSTNTC